MTRLKVSLALFTLLSATYATSARAHVCMDAPTSRVGAGCNFASPQKNGPCGVNQRSAKPTEFKPGQTITLTLNETIDHPSHYRIAFNPNGDTFEDPTSKDDKDGGHPNILLDGIADEDAAKQSIQVTLPNVTCDNCTLQLIQVMYDKAGNGFGGKDSTGKGNDDIYYACADIVLKGELAAGSADAGSSGDLAPPRDTGGSKDAGAPDAAVGAPKPVVDAGKPAGGDAASGRADAATAHGDDDGEEHTDHEEGEEEEGEEEDDQSSASSSSGGCSADGRSAPPTTSLLLGLSLVAFAARRRRR